MSKSKKSRAQYILFGLYGITTLCLAASISGTFAWYTYSTRTGLTFEGTSVSDTDSLQIGVVSGVRIPDYADYGFQEDTSINGKIIYWSQSDLSADRINHIISANNSATNMITAMTSGKYHPGETDFVLYETPTHCSNYITDSNLHTLSRIARQSDYVTLPLAFRMASESHEGTYLPDKNIYFTKCDIKSREQISDAVRIYMCGNVESETYLINPNEKYDGFDTVGGILDLDVNGYYDYWTDPDTDKMYEYPYGEFKDGYHYSSTPTTSDSNELGQEELTTFDANKKGGVYPIDWSRTTPETAEYKGMANFMNHRLEVTTTNQTKNYGYLTLVVYLEGWDLSVINSELGHAFSMDLSFEIG